ncbi:MAG: radical SAM protein [Bacteroidales bacterium]|nr:radical SAM protein [Bacteroidales bacterium]
MEEKKNFDLAEYMNNGIRNFMAKAYKNVLSNPREARFAFKMQRSFEKSEKRRRKIKETEDLDVPPFLISSIATSCNLHCKGCYARSNGIANDEADGRKPSLTPEQWHGIFTEAAEMGVNFSLLAGGEPLMRRDILEKVATVGDMVFPVFTNGTLIGSSQMAFWRDHLNMIPIISIEGTAMGTDRRRGQGVFKRAMQAMEALAAEDLFFGTSITVTTENYQFVTSSEFIARLIELGCKIVFYVEYVPTEAGTEHLAFSDEHVREMENLLEQRRMAFPELIFFSFPGDEKESGGCLASGRGFFHIGPDGSAEPCPFSPFSDSNVIDLGLKGAMQSPLFKKIRAANALNWEHTGGCTLFEHQDEVKQMLA